MMGIQRKSRWQVYRRILKGLGMRYGLKDIVMIITAHFYKREHTFWIRSKKTGDEKLYVRTNSSDLELIHSFLLDNGEFDWLSDPRVFAYIKSSKHFVDGGANIGLVSRLLLAVNPKMKGILIEPDDLNYKSIRKNLHSFPDIKCVKGALWNGDKKLAITARNGGSRLGFTVKENEAGDIKGYKVKTLIKDYKIDIFKIDIEGSEYELFDDSADEWVTQIGVFIIELHDRIKAGCRKQVEGRLLSNGFIHASTKDENDIFIREDVWETWFSKGFE